MSDASHPPIPARPFPPLPANATGAAPDPADLGTAYGMELSIDAPAAKPAPDADQDPLAWIRRWVERHKAG